MASHHRYLAEMSELGYSATWLPSIRLRTGSFGRFTRHGFDLLGDVADLGLKIQCEHAKATTELQRISKGGASIDFKAHMVGSPQESIGCVVDFNFESAVVFAASKCKTTQVSNLHTLERDLINLHESGKWKLDWSIVVETLDAAQTTILISGTDKASVSLGWNGKADSASLALPSMRIVNSSGMLTQVVGAGGLTPLFKARTLKKSLFRGHKALHALPAAASDANQLSLVETTYEFDRL